MCHALTRARTLAAAIGERGTRAIIWRVHRVDVLDDRAVDENVEAQGHAYIRSYDFVMGGGRAHEACLVL